MDIARTSYLNQLIEARGDGNIKIISGLRRCGKSYLLKRLFKQYLLDSGVPQKHIILIDLKQRKNSAFLDPDFLQDYVENAIVDDDTYYILLDEVQRVRAMPILTHRSSITSRTWASATASCLPVIQFLKDPNSLSL